MQPVYLGHMAQEMIDNETSLITITDAALSQLKELLARQDVPQL